MLGVFDEEKTDLAAFEAVAFTLVSLPFEDRRRSAPCVHDEEKDEGELDAFAFGGKMVFGEAPVMVQ